MSFRQNGSGFKGYFGTVIPDILLVCRLMKDVIFLISVIIRQEIKDRKDVVKKFLQSDASGNR